MLDRCPHRAAALSEGRMTSSGYLQCAYHGRDMPHSSVWLCCVPRERSRACACRDFLHCNREEPKHKSAAAICKGKVLVPCSISHLMCRLVLRWGDRRLHKHPPGFTWGRDLRPHLRYSAALCGETGPHLGLPLSRGTEPTHQHHRW